MKPVLLDTFCGAFGASQGYADAGFVPYGIDHDPKPLRHQRFPSLCMDAIEALDRLLAGEGLTFSDGRTLTLADITAIHASPPCQEHTIARQIHPEIHYPELIPPTRERLKAIGKPYVIENVPGAPLQNYFQLCGLTFGLNVKRHRWFEMEPAFGGLIPSCPKGHPGDWLLVFGQTVLNRGKTIGRAKGGGPRIHRTHQGTDAGRAAMGLDWMNRDELSEAIPKEYTKFIGAWLIAHIKQEQPL